MTGATVPAAGSPSSGADYGPWNPGIDSRMPREVLPLATIHRPDNVFTSIARAEELHDLTGLDVLELVAFRPERLLLHELLIRVTAELAVPTGARVEDLGINFRQMTSTLLARHLSPRLGEITEEFASTRHKLAQVIREELDAQLFATATGAATAPVRQRPARLFGFLRRAPTTAPAATPASPDAVVARWHARASDAAEPLRSAACAALARVVGAILSRHGALWGTPELIAGVATDLAGNDFGGDEIGRRIDPLLRAAAEAEGFQILPLQTQPVIMNTKGASAAGKSTMRPEQRALAQRIGVDWAEFALISPDIWRKQLLDYASLGPAYKYGGACTGDELGIIDQKLDRYMARKAREHGTTHLLIDRFRFDSFAADSEEAGSNLLTRFGHTVYLFFMVTPPEALVERAWQRGLEVGRYKAVDDILAHNIEAYAGMPELFFTWALRRDKDVHYEFLDNTVPLGERPRTAAFGWNGELHVLDVKRLLDIERFRRVDVDASEPAALYPDASVLAPERNTAFLVACARRLPRVQFVAADSGRVYLQIDAGVPTWADAPLLEQALADPDVRASVAAVAPAAIDGRLPAPAAPQLLQELLGARPYARMGTDARLAEPTQGQLQPRATGSRMP